MNQYLSNLLYSWATASGVNTYLTVFFSEYLLYAIVVGVLYWAFRRRTTIWQTILLFVPAAGNRVVLTEIMRLFIYSPRPFITDHLAALVSDPQREWYTSFPSGHTIFLFSLATSVWFENKKAGAVLAVLAAFVGIARVAAGVHWPTDILGGALLGIVFTVPEVLVLGKLFPARKR